MGERKIEKETEAGERKRETGMRERKIERQEREEREIRRETGVGENERGGKWVLQKMPRASLRRTE